MALTRPTSRFINLALFLLLLLSLLLSVMSSEAPNYGNDDLAGLEELLAIDEEEERKGETAAHGKPSDAEVLSRAQRIVLGLSNENVKRIIDGNEFVLVLGYAPWCPRSAELMPRFAEAATSLREMGSTVFMAKIDAERHTKAASLLGIKGFPTLLLFVNGSAQSYTGGYTRDEIIIWVRKKTGAPILRLPHITAAEEFLTRHQIFIVGLFENPEGPEYEEFVKAAITDNEIQFVEVNDINVAKVLFPDIRTKKHFLGLVKSEPERFVTFEEAFKEEKILKFINYYKFPLVTTLTELNSARVYSSPIKLQVFIFAQTDNFKHLLLPLQDVAGRYKTKIMFIYVDSEEDDLAKPFLTLFGLESEKHIVTAFDNRIGSKYLFESDLTPNNLDGFCARLLDGTLPPYFKSEPFPDDMQKGIVQKVVGRTFSGMVLDSSQNIFLEVFTPWCIDCEATSKQIETLAKHFKELDNLLVARIDASLNEHAKLQIDNFPTLLFYPSQDKSNPIKLSKKSSVKELIAFIETNVKSDVDRISSREHISKEAPIIKEEL